VSDDPLLVLVREHDVGPEGPDGVAECLDAGVADGAPGSEVDADAGALGASELGGA
jgi:hypothetical protein